MFVAAKPVYKPQPSKQERVKENFNIQEAVGFLKMYPNPAQKQFTIDYKVATNSHIYIRIVNITGQSIYQHISQNKEDKLVVNVENMPSGLYFCQLIVDDVIRFNEKINIIQ